MSDHPFVPLPAGTALGKSFEYGLDVNLGTSGSPTWQPVRRISAWAPSFPATTADISSYDDRGAPSEEITARGFSGSFTVQGNRSTTTGLYLPELEALIAAGKATGAGAVVQVRWYHKPDVGAPSATDAGMAYATVEVTRSKTGNAETEEYSVTLSGRGRYTPITNPWTGWTATTPVVTAISPTGAGTGKMVTITGTGLLGATSVKFGATEATEKLIVSGSTIIATLPSGTAGSVAVTVVTPGGTSTGVNYTRAA